MPGKTPRVAAAQEALDAAIRELIAASDEMDLADARRLDNFELIEMLEPLANKSVVTHWAVAASRTYWERDKDDPEDTEEYPYTKCVVLVRDNTTPYWIISGLLRRCAEVADDE